MNVRKSIGSVGCWRPRMDAPPPWPTADDVKVDEVTELVSVKSFLSLFVLSLSVCVVPYRSLSPFSSFASSLG